ncbi:MAG: ABC transporter permease [Chloroflexi bacterium RIFCSPLOWO2_12_FULL_71_12]|nr:MAG: ABC transporter permease [Chloroflexi bacterium RIFCSPLOWO2_02_FULL_71_16]OGO73177.1 MAG: ABC transporter permease [Chloroflexi bacterium RIFCSPLOWO2_12_FULL_71_12]
MDRTLRVPPRVLAAGALKHLILVAGAVLTAFPFYWMVTTSFKSFAEAQSYPPVLWPTVWHFENWQQAWEFPTTLWARSFANTLGIAAVSTLGTLVTAVLAAYAFARMRFRGRNVLFAIFLLTIFIPSEATLIPNFVLITKYLGWYNTYQAQIVPFLASVFSIFLLRQFFMSVPQELQDAARIDGAGHVRFLWSVALPLVRPALITVALLNFLASWNSFLWPLLVTSSPEIRPIQVALVPFSSEAGTQYHLLMAGATFVILPTLVVYLIAQRYFIEGVARTGIRG